MLDITLTEFKNTYCKSMTWSEFAKYSGFTLTFLSKIKNGKYDCINSSKWFELKQFIKDHCGKNLISEEKYGPQIRKLNSRIRDLELVVKSKDQEIASLVNVISNLTSSVRIISSAKEALAGADFILSKYNKEGR